MTTQSLSALKRSLSTYSSVEIKIIIIDHCWGINTRNTTASGTRERELRTIVERQLVTSDNYLRCSRTLYRDTQSLIDLFDLSEIVRLFQFS